eukprot:TRINITY_DN30_c0_g1_i8.p2 TRINITY_DN30_c0_g1~~TRINITY_DN30_c0_g1_i8.p2  ORF type:complete len:171 (-),score=10.02 TRINITY_DN30_c0_g1_i8:1403-1915(-)
MNFLECSLALLLALAINISVLALSGAVCSRHLLSASDRDNCENIALDRTPFLLKNVLGGWSRKLFGIALLASGQSSAITGTYAGQYVMQGFLELRFKLWLRNLVTRVVAIMPSLAVAIIGGSKGAGNLIIFSTVGIFMSMATKKRYTSACHRKSSDSIVYACSQYPGCCK